MDNVNTGMTHVRNNQDKLSKEMQLLFNMLDWLNERFDVLDGKVTKMLQYTERKKRVGK